MYKIQCNKSFNCVYAQVYRAVLRLGWQRCLYMVTRAWCLHRCPIPMLWGSVGAVLVPASLGSQKIPVISRHAQV